MTLSFYLYDDARARDFQPFTLTRPVSELRTGALLLRQRWTTVCGVPAAGFLSGVHLADFEEFDAPAGVSDEDTLPAGAIVANARCAIALDEQLADDATVWTCDGLVCAVRLPAPIPASYFAEGACSLDGLLTDDARAGARPVRGRWLTEVWDFIGQLSPQLTEDILALAPLIEATPVPHTATLGEHPVIIERGASIEPYVVLDATAGPIMVRAGTVVSAFTRLVGPCYIGEDCTIIGDRVANCSVGEHSKIRGEISSSIILGHSNKGHTGFVGHSYLGRWVNLGAATTTSNLKNTYGNVQLWTPSGLRSTDLLFLGTLAGDHAKTGIGTMLTTGTVLGAGANVYGGGTPPKHVPPFSWGDGEPYGTFAMDKFLAVAERVMGRRKVTMGERQRRQLAQIHPERHL